MGRDVSQDAPDAVGATAGSTSLWTVQVGLVAAGKADTGKQSGQDNGLLARFGKQWVRHLVPAVVFHGQR